MSLVAGNVKLRWCNISVLKPRRLHFSKHTTFEPNFSECDERKYKSIEQKYMKDALNPKRTIFSQWNGIFIISKLDNVPIKIFNFIFLPIGCLVKSILRNQGTRAGGSLDIIIAKYLQPTDRNKLQSQGKLIATATASECYVCCLSSN